MSNHITIRVYPNKRYVINIVSDENLKDHLAYNRDFRFGCLVYLDGKRVQNGCRKEEYLQEYDDFVKTISLDGININKETIPFS